MKVYFKSTFIKDFKSLPTEIKNEISVVCTKSFLKIKSLSEFKKYHIKKLSGFSQYYRIKIGDYRVGFKKDGNYNIIFMRVKNRKDIYKIFP